MPILFYPLVMCKNTIVCRVCLETPKNAYFSLSEQYQGFALYESINTITTLKIRLNDGFPDKICAACHSQLIASIDFKEKCKASDVALRSNAVKHELPADDKKLAVKNEFASKTIKIEYNDVNSDDNFDCTIILEQEQDIKQENDNEECQVFVIQHQADTQRQAIDLELVCDDCGDSFKSKCKLKVHWHKMHMSESLVCPLCKRAFKSYKAFHQHKMKKTKACAIAADDNVNVEGVGKSRIFCCKHCDYRTKRIHDIKPHVVTHTGDRPFKCDLCSKSYTQIGTLNGHREMAHKMFVCEMTCHICGKFVKGRRGIEQHLKLHNKVECAVCHKKILKVSYPQHMKRHSGTKSYACEKCTCTFYTLSELCQHKRLKHPSNMLKCEQCEFTCVKKHVMKTHRIKHSSNDIPCTVCGRFFVTEEKMVHHQRVHFTEQPFNCPHCKAKFFHKESLRLHEKVKHVEEVKELKAAQELLKSHNCPKCDAKFFKRDSMMWHLKRKHSETVTGLKTAPLVVKQDVNGLLPSDITN